MPQRFHRDPLSFLYSCRSMRREHRMRAARRCRGFTPSPAERSGRRTTSEAARSSALPCRWPGQGPHDPRAAEGRLVSIGETILGNQPRCSPRALHFDCLSRRRRLVARVAVKPRQPCWLLPVTQVTWRTSECFTCGQRECKNEHGAREKEYHQAKSCHGSPCTDLSTLPPDQRSTRRRSGQMF